MKRNAFALSVAAAVGAFGLAGVATAGVIAGGAFNITGSVGPVAGTPRTVDANALVPGRFKIGHILLGEYFTTQNGNATMLHITNTDQNNGKAVKVRFRSAQNSDDVFDFTILMSPGDMWTGGIVADEATGRSKMITADTSCTLPPVVNGELFPTDRLPSSKTDAQKASMTREGYIEVLNMANIPSDKVALGKEVYDSNVDGAGKTGALYRATKHSAGKPTCDSAVINTLKTNPTTMQQAADLGLDLPSGGLFANVNIVNVPNTASYANQAAAVVAANAGVSSTGNIVFYPQTGGDAGNVDAAAVLRNLEQVIGGRAVMAARRQRRRGDADPGARAGRRAGWRRHHGGNDRLAGGGFCGGANRGTLCRGGSGIDHRQGAIPAGAHCTTHGFWLHQLQSRRPRRHASQDRPLYGASLQPEHGRHSDGKQRGAIGAHQRHSDHVHAVDRAHRRIQRRRRYRRPSRGADPGAAQPACRVRTRRRAAR